MFLAATEIVVFLKNCQLGGKEEIQTLPFFSPTLENCYQ